MDKRTALIDAAAQLAHEHGFGATTLAMVAERSRVPLGNVYYYFRTKEALADAVLERRHAELDALLANCAGAGDAPDQLVALLRFVRSEADEVAKSGCPLGRISQDVGAGIDCTKALPLAKMSSWCEDRMKAIGMTGAKARDAALHFVAALQGASLLAWVQHDPKIIRTETRTLEAWVRSL